MFFALSPNLKVDNVSFSYKTDGDTFITKAVREFPPNDSCNNLVS